jgi:hypothetical protein
MDPTSKTPSGGTCWIRDISFPVWFDLDCWDWESRDAIYFDLLSTDGIALLYL